MTPGEEMGEALGAGWVWQDGWRGGPGRWLWFPKGPEAPGVEVLDADDGIGGWTVSFVGDNDGIAVIEGLPAPTAVYVARLLVAVERVVAGAEVAAFTPGPRQIAAVTATESLPPAEKRGLGIALLVWAVEP